MQIDISGTSFRHQCDLAAAVYDVKLEELLTWNPELGDDTAAPNCSFKTGFRYCGRFYVDTPPPPVEGPNFFFPLRVGLVTCTQKSFRADDRVTGRL